VVVAAAAGRRSIVVCARCSFVSLRRCTAGQRHPRLRLRAAAVPLCPSAVMVAPPLLMQLLRLMQHQL
jgi:hypothetical protein